MPLSVSHTSPTPQAWLLALPLVLALGACDLFGGGESPEVAAQRKEAEGKAVGAACRHAGRAIEDCFALNRRIDKSAVFSGWREMNDYMRENKMDAVQPQLTSPPAESAARVDEPPAAADESAKKPAKPKTQSS
jgi:hypothetical protein